MILYKKQTYTDFDNLMRWQGSSEINFLKKLETTTIHKILY